MRGVKVMAPAVQLGRVGIWSSRFWAHREAAQDAARELERLGYGAVWFNNGADAFGLARDLLGATSRIVVASGILNIWTHRAQDVAAGHAALAQTFPHRFLLGLGVSHAPQVDRDQAGRYSHPYERMVAYLDALDTAQPPVPADERVLAALGPRMLALARERSAGAHPYLVTVEHTRSARQVLGDGPLLAPEQAVVLESRPSRARGIARAYLALYLQLPNYTNNLLRHGFTPEDLAGGGSDHLVDALVAWGSVDAIRERVADHLRAGADHVCLQALTEDPATLPLDEWRALAALADIFG
jgi:probable F420-dependent oxidoreductase